MRSSRWRARRFSSSRCGMSGLPARCSARLAHPGAEADRGVAEGVVEEPDLDGAPRADGLERGRGEANGHLGADAAREQVGPVLRAVEASHVLVVRIQDGVLACHDVIGGERQRHPTGRGVAGEGRDHEVRVGLEVSSRTRSLMARRFRHDSLARVVGRLDDVEMDPVGERVAAAHQHDDVGLRRPAA